MALFPMATGGGTIQDITYSTGGRNNTLSSSLAVGTLVLIVENGTSSNTYSLSGFSELSNAKGFIRDGACNNVILAKVTSPSQTITFAAYTSIIDIYVLS